MRRIWSYKQEEEDGKRNAQQHLKHPGGNQQRTSGSRYQEGSKNLGEAEPEENLSILSIDSEG